MLAEQNQPGQEIALLIKNNQLDKLRHLIKWHPQVLNQKDSEGFTPVFHSLLNANLEILKTIIDADQKVLEQKNENGETPILLLIQLNIDIPSEQNIEKMKIIFKKQFNRDLEDKEIENLGDFVKNFNFLKLFYDDLGQAFYGGQLKAMISSFLPKKEDLSDDLTKDLVEIYNEITNEKNRVIKFIDVGEERKKLYIYEAEIGRHSAYFIFHVENENKLTKISYCDGNQFFKHQNVDDSVFINGITTFKLKEPLYFANPGLDDERFFHEFIQKTSQGKDFEVFYKEEFTDEKLAQKKIGEIEFSAKTHSIPIKKQTRLNCSLKSMFLLARFILEEKKERELFTYDSAISSLIGDGYKAHKEFKQKIVDNATEKLIESAKKIDKNFIRKTGVFERIFDFLHRSFAKEGDKKNGSPTKFLSITNQKFHNFIAQIFKAKLCSDDEEFRQKLEPKDLKNYLSFIFCKNINFDEYEIKKIGSFLSEKNVKIDGFLDWKFSSSEIKNSFVKLVLEHGNADQKTDFLQQISQSDFNKRSNFFKDLIDESHALIIRENEKKIKLSEDDSASVSSGKVSKNEILANESKPYEASFDCIRVREIDRVEVGEKRPREEGGASSEIEEVKKDPFYCIRITEKFTEKKLRESDFDEEKVDCKSYVNDRDRGGYEAGLSPRIIGVNEVNIKREFTPEF